MNRLEKQLAEFMDTKELNEKKILALEQFQSYCCSRSELLAISSQLDKYVQHGSNDAFMKNVNATLK